MVDVLCTVGTALLARCCACAALERRVLPICAENSTDEHHPACFAKGLGVLLCTMQNAECRWPPVERR
jgi:hypothetical protein